MMTGYYGVPGSKKGNFKVHVVRDGKPLCGWRPRKEMEFQFCAHGLQLRMVECGSCRRVAETILRDGGCAKPAKKCFTGYLT